jgi:hypothetical protein
MWSMRVIGTKKITSGILIAVSLGLIVWDVFMAGNATHGDTISEIVLNFAFNNPSIPFALGCIMGHLFWPQLVKED